MVAPAVGWWWFRREVKRVIMASEQMRRRGHVGFEVKGILEKKGEEIGLSI